MAGLEVVVRPVVFPNIRPPAPRVLAIEDAPDKGVATISGGGGGIIDLPYSQSSSWSRSRIVETRRTYDVVRMYHKKKDGKPDKDKYLDVEVLRALDYDENNLDPGHIEYAKQDYDERDDVLAENQQRDNPVDYGGETSDE